MNSWMKGMLLVLILMVVSSCKPEKTLTLSLTLEWPQAEGTTQTYPASVDRLYIRVISESGVISGYSRTKLQTPIELKDQDEGTFSVEVTASLDGTDTWQATKSITLTKPSGDSADWTIEESMTMAALVDFSFALPDTLPVNSDPTQLTIQSTGFNTNRVIWRVNGIEGGNDEFGRLISSGLYTPPTTVPTEPVVTIEGFPEGFESFASTRTVTLVNDFAETAVIFAARTDPIEPLTLWRSDGTANGTFPLEAVTVANDDLINAARIGETRFFRARTNSGTYELWQSDGSVAGTRHIPIGSSENAPGMAAGSQPLDIFVADDQLFLNGRSGDQGAYEFLKLDPESGDFDIIFPSAVSSGNGARNFAGQLDDQLIVAHNNYLTGAYSVYSVDAQTPTVDDTLVSVVNPVQVHDLARIGDDILFVLNDRTLMKTDGTPSGTSTLLSMVSGNGMGETTWNLNSSRNMLLYQGAYYFTAGHRDDGFTLYKSEGSIAGTGPFITLSAQVPATDNPHTFFELNNQLYFFSDSAEESVRGLWMSQGSTATTTKVKMLDGFYGSAWYTAKKSAQFAKVESLNKVFFVAGDQELWVSDGTANGTQRVKDFGGTYGDKPGMLMDAGNFLLFTVIDSDGRAKLWRTDGTEANTDMVKDVCETCSDYGAFFEGAA